jgi:hypothetical protein
MKKRRKSRAKNALPKGSYPVPAGGYVTESVHVSADGRRLRVKAYHRAEPDLEMLARALIALADDQARRQP